MKEKHKHGYYRSLKRPKKIKMCNDNYRKMHHIPMLRHKTWWKTRTKRLSHQKSKWDVDCYLEVDMDAYVRAITMDYPWGIDISKREERKYYGTT